VPPAKPLATPKEVAEYLQRDEQTLANWRCAGTGPDYIKTGKTRAIRYRWDDVETWLTAKTVRPRQGS